VGEIQTIQFRHDSNHVYAKTSLDGEWERFSFMKKASNLLALRSLGPLRTGPRGVPTAKKEEIVRKLVPLMLPLASEDKMQFWRNLPVDDVADLAVESDGSDE